MGHALYLSLTTYDLLSPPRFVGLRNYTALWHDPLFHQSAGVTLYYVLGTCVPLWGLALLLALVLNRPWPARGRCGSPTSSPPLCRPWCTRSSGASCSTPMGS